VGGGLLVIQTFAPLLSFAAEGLWLPQGRYLFSGMGLIAPVMASHALAVRVDRYGLVMLMACIWLVLALSLYNTAFGYYSAIAP